MPDKRCIMRFSTTPIYGAGGTGDYPQCATRISTGGIGDTLAKWYEAVVLAPQPERCR